VSQKRGDPGYTVGIMLAKTSAAIFVSVPSAAMAERRDRFLVMVQAPGLCMEGAGQGGKPQLSHDILVWAIGALIRAGGQVAGGRFQRPLAAPLCALQIAKEECVQAGPDVNPRR
jgi:hypothetical protein